jgi:RNA polymerase-associated protein
MTQVLVRRSGMVLFSDPSCLYSHRTRLVIAEKGINVEVIDAQPGHLPEDLLDLNPYNSLPTLVDRDLVLYDSRVIIEYLDERFPHPPLLPVDPVSRAKSRLVQFRIENDWYALLPDIGSRSEKRSSTARKLLAEGLSSSGDVFAALPFFMSEELSLIDCCLAPLLWRLPTYGIDIPARGPLHAYMQRIFARPGFRQSLSEIELEMRD